MFERQRALLALVDVLGGRVPATDFSKLLFLWNQDLDVAHYDFVPYRFGAFSFTSYADRRKLIEKKLLEDESDWVLTRAGRAVVEEAPALRRRAVAFALRAPKVRGDSLVALTYRDHPFFAIRSEVADRVLATDSRALQAISDSKPPRTRSGLATIGYEGRSLEAYLVALLRAGVSLLCDVRRNPISRKYGFSKSTLSKACENVGIHYVHLPELGIASSERQSLKSEADYEALFASYRAFSLPNEGAAVGQISDWIDDGHLVALTCFEHRPKECHRHCVADAVQRSRGCAEGRNSTLHL